LPSKPLKDLPAETEHIFLILVAINQRTVLARPRIKALPQCSRAGGDPRNHRLSRQN
jgi:hypothetical protein